MGSFRKFVNFFTEKSVFQIQTFLKSKLYKPVVYDYIVPVLSRFEFGAATTVLHTTILYFFL